MACGKTGNCWVYDVDKFRYYLHTAAFFFMMLGSLFDVGVIFYADRIKNIYDDEELEEEVVVVDPNLTMIALKERSSPNENVLFQRLSVG